WIGVLAVWQRSSEPLQTYQATFGTLGLLILLMAWVYGGLLAVLVGAQVNISVGRQRALQAPPQVQRTVIPPSFESFTIRRRDDRLP
ncbi:MAG: hypothetical protein ICV77_10320, partial [Cyanobacteria bacterium Co-bin8]|nr:hypothetical protein [Cyanobacteria bacterium Co-bin8]